jgi:ATP synthase protein I
MEKPGKDSGDTFSRIIAEKERRKLKAMNENKETAWFGLKTFGMVGWSVSVPTVVGVFGGIWLDKNYPESFSWTITCLLSGLAIGCLIAWKWVIKDD